MSFIQTSGDDRTSKLSKWYKIGIAAVVCLAVSPIIFMVVKGIVGLLVAAALGLTAVNLAPWFSMKLSTWTLKLISKDAEDNPVETRIQIEQQTENELNRFSEEITQFAGSLSTFKDQVASITAKYPQKTQQYKVQLQTMEALLENRKRMWKIAKANLVEYKQETVEIGDLWDMANAAQKMSKIAGIIKGNDPMKEFRTRVANKSVQNKMNNAMAQLSTALMEEASELPALSMSQPETLEMNAIGSNVYVPVNR